ncbi:MAG: hypothetical protein LBM16_01015 [Clostridiales bacterium]|jgi:glycogen debranching enzyme|nr:hypothetical protein [Clostridiales bacterium]
MANTTLDGLNMLISEGTKTIGQFITDSGQKIADSLSQDKTLAAINAMKDSLYKAFDDAIESFESRIKEYADSLVNLDKAIDADSIMKSITDVIDLIKKSITDVKDTIDKELSAIEE